MTLRHKLRWIASNWVLLAACWISPRDDAEHLEHLGAAARRAEALVRGTAEQGEAA